MLKTSIEYPKQAGTRVVCATGCGISLQCGTDAAGNSAASGDQMEADARKIGWAYHDRSTMTNPLLCCPSCVKKGLLSGSNDISVGDMVMRGVGLSEDDPKDYNTLQMSKGRTYEVEWIHPRSGLLVLKDFLMLVHPDTVIRV